MVVFLSIRVVETPPNVSIPNERGVTSSKRISSTSPESTPPWIAAPSATTSSGFTLLFGSFPKISFTLSWIFGIRVDPPTKITSSISDFDRPASFIACRQGWIVRSTRSFTNSSNFALDSVRFKCFGPDASAVTKGRLISVCFEDESSFFAVSAASFNRWSAMASFLRSMPSDFINSSAIQSITF